MENLERRIAEGLLSIRAVFFRPDEPFIWASGIKSPVYCDNRLILTAPAVRTAVETALMQVVIEDLISTGGSVLAVVNVLREAGADVLGVASIFTYGMQKGLTRLAEANVKNRSLTNFDVIAAVAAEQKYIQPEDVARLTQFRNNPADESWIGGNH